MLFLFQICPLGVADHVNLGLIPSSEMAWVAAVQALNRERGGVLHVHGNADVPNEAENLADILRGERGNCLRRFRNRACNDIDKIVRKVFGKDWEAVADEDVQTVKSYGPRVDHLVVDIRVVRQEVFNNGSITNTIAES